MTTANFKHLLHELFRRAELYMVSLGADRRCALKLDRIGDRLLGMGARIRQLRERMEDGFVDEPVDEDCALRESLRGLKEDIRAIRCQLFSMQGPGLSARMQRAFARLSGIAEETYALADKLQWEIEEHDARFAL